MTPLFKKLNYKNQTHILSLNAPDSFLSELSSMSDFATIITDETQITSIEFVIVFGTKQTEIDNFAERIYAKLKGDAVLWFCYPKGTSKKYKCDFNRDNGWSNLAKYNLESVRQVAIDEDWSALRFRKTEFIKTLRRKETFAISAEGKKRVQNAGDTNGRQQESIEKRK